MGDDDREITTADLDAIERLALADAHVEPAPDAAWTVVIGTVTLRDGRTLRAELMLERERGALVLTGASG